MNTLPLWQAPSTNHSARTLAAVFIGMGAYGLWSLASQVMAESWPGDAAGWLSLAALVGQIGLALTGGIWLWHGHRRGARLLLILSYTCLPALSSFLHYLTTFGLGVYVQLVITDQGGGLQSGFLYGVATEVALDPAPSEHVIGINLMALGMIAWCRHHLGEPNGQEANLST